MSSVNTLAELRDIERRLAALRGETGNTLGLYACILLIVTATAALPLGILGTIAMARQMARRRGLLRRAAAIEHALAGLTANMEPRSDI